MELNGRVVSIKSDNNQTTEDVAKTENSLLTEYVGKEILFKGKLSSNEVESVQEKVTAAQTIQSFVENQKFGNNSYMRFTPVDEHGRLNEHGRLSDQDVERYLTLINEIKKEAAWLHVNSIVGRGPATLLVALRDMVENGKNATLDEFKTRYSKLFEQPKPEDKNSAAKIDRALFLSKFYAFITQDKYTKWSEWKASGQLS